MPRLLDLFCGGGGAAMGYHRAGFEVVGVDNCPQPHYPFEFILADFRDIDYSQFDAVHASPPCQSWTTFKSLYGVERPAHPQHIAPTRLRMRMAGRPYVIENVPGAPLDHPIMLCGSMFGCRTVDGWLRRHRMFECSFPVPQLSCNHPTDMPCLGVYGGGGMANKARRGTAYERREMMGIDWLPSKSLNQAIPPAYTEYIGHHLMEHLKSHGVVS